MLPDMSSGPPCFHCVLSDWQQGKYSSGRPSRDSPFLAYVFSDQYSENDLRGGVNRLGDADAYMVSHLLPIAQKLGFIMQLASLHYTVSGEARDLDGVTDSDTKAQTNTRSTIGVNDGGGPTRIRATVGAGETLGET
jgi:hypothetical protein